MNTDPHTHEVKLNWIDKDYVTITYGDQHDSILAMFPRILFAESRIKCRVRKLVRKHDLYAVRDLPSRASIQASAQAEAIRTHENIHRPDNQ